MKKLRFIIPLLSMFLFLAINMNNVSASQGVTIYINGEKQAFSNEAIIEKGSTLVPLRGIFEKLGATVTWNQKDQSISATKGNSKIWLKIGSTNAKVNGNNVKLAVPAKIVKGKTLVPLRFISESLGESVKWDQSTSSVIIGSGDGSGDIKEILFSMDVNQVKKTEKSLLIDEVKDREIHGLYYQTSMYGYPVELIYLFQHGKLSYIVYDFLPYKNNYHTWDQMAALHDILHRHAENEFGKGVFTSDEYNFLSTMWKKEKYDILLNINDRNVYTLARLTFYPK